MNIVLLLMLCLPSNYFCTLLNDLDIHAEHLEYFLHNVKVNLLCHQEGCLSKEKIKTKKCWGHEEGCQKEDAFSKMTCDGDSKGWTTSLAKQKAMFYNEADFGYVKQFRDTLQPLCKGKDKEDSFLACTKNLEFCKGNSIAIDFRGLLNRTEPVRYHMDVLKDGQISGTCRLDKHKLSKSLVYVSPLQSWAPELRFFKEEQDITCDTWVEKPAIIIKLDAPVSMYHHFCDFFNLFASQHLNSSDPFDFHTDTQILIWETYPYRSNFGASWKAYTKNPLWSLNDVKGKRMCFRNVMFPLLARGIFGLYYNTPIIPGCSGSGLFRAFSQHFLHRLGVVQARRTNQIHVTWLSRNTKYRRINNEDELMQALANQRQFLVRKVEYSHHDPFIQQLEQDQWTDILIGMHGSGLTHTLFLPDWAVLFEIYHCEDPNCYNDLARLRGIHHISWEDIAKMTMHDDVQHPDYRSHEKYRNYSFDKKEFMRLMTKAEKLVRQNPRWQRLQNGRSKDEL